MLKQKLIGIGIIFLTIICIIKGEPLISLLTVPVGMVLLFGKRNWLYY